MKIWPKAPQAAKPRMSGKIPGFRCMKDRAAESSEAVLEEGESGVGGNRGDARR